MNPSRVLIADPLSPRAVEILSRSPAIRVDVKVGLKPAELAAIIGDYDALLVRSTTRVTAELLARAPRLRLIGRAGIGVDNVDVAAASVRGVVVMNTPFGNATTTAEHAIAMLLAVSRHIPQATASMRSGKWEKTRFEGREVTGKILGVIGLGNIGRIVADRARGLRMQVMGYDPFISAEAASRLGVEKASLAELFARADYVTVHTPLTAETKNLIGEAAFVAMKPGVFVINCARGGIVDEKALQAALQAGKVAGAALDVFEQEPVAADHPLLQDPRVILTPHLGASTFEAQETVSVQLAEQVAAYLADGTVANAVNTPSVTGEVLRTLSPYLELGAKLGALAAQLHAGEIRKVELVFQGELAAMETAPITARVVMEILNRKVEPQVNMVSALPVSRERGVAVETTQVREHPDYTNLMTLRLHGGDATTTVEGALFGKRDLRIVGIDGYRMDLHPYGQILVVRNDDRPGIIGAVGTTLGQRGINVSRLAVGLREGGTEALAIWSTDQPVSDEVMEELRKPAGMHAVQRLAL